MLPTSVIVCSYEDAPYKPPPLWFVAAASSAVMFVAQVPFGASAAGVQTRGSLAETEPRRAGFGREVAPYAPKVTGPPSAEPPWPCSAVPRHTVQRTRREFPRLR